MTEEDQPPEEIWLDSEAINAHFDAVKERYRARAGGEEYVPDPTDWDQNDLTKGLRR